MLFPISIFALWCNMTFYFISRFTKKKGKNIISAIHATVVILSYILGINGYYVYILSTTHYIIDIATLISYKISKFDFIMILHHIFTIGIASYLNDKNIGNIIFFGYFLAEISNYPNYIGYHILHSGKILGKCILLLEFLSYGIIRGIGGIIYIIIIIITKYQYLNIFLLSAIILIWIESLNWTKKIYNKLFRQPRFN